MDKCKPSKKQRRPFPKQRPIPHTIVEWIKFYEKNKSYLGIDIKYAVLKVVEKANDLTECGHKERALELHHFAEKANCITMYKKLGPKEYLKWLDENETFTKSCYRPPAKSGCGN